MRLKIISIFLSVSMTLSILLTGGVSAKITDISENISLVSFINQDFYENSDGKFLPEERLLRYQVAEIIYNLFGLNEVVSNTYLKSFNDVSSAHSAANEIAYSVKEGIFQGYEGKYNPDGQVTRAEMAKILYTLGVRNFYGVPVNFSDTINHWAKNEIGYMASEGIITGYPDKTFNPDAGVTRAEGITMISRYLQRSENFNTNVTFKDVPASHWAYRYIMGAVNGINKTADTNSVTALNLTSQRNAYGTVTVEKGSTMINNKGDEIIVKAIPESGFVFIGWTLTDKRTSELVSTSPTYSFKVSGNTKLFAIFNGNGLSEVTPIEVYTASDLLSINENIDSLSKHYKLMSAIDLSEENIEWKPIGSAAYPFTGTFNGNYFKVMNLSIKDGKIEAGLFGVVSGSKAKLVNISVVNALVISVKNSGVIAGSLIDNVQISSCDASGSVIANGDSANAGGIAGFISNNVKLSKCHFDGGVSAKGYRSNAGGIAGQSELGSIIALSYSSGSVNSMNSDTGAGGITGLSYGGATRDCYSTANVVSSGYAGGISGKLASGGSVRYCYAKGNISGVFKAGGLVGESDYGYILSNVALNPKVEGGTVGKIAGSHVESTDKRMNYNIAAEIVSGTFPITDAYDSINGKTETMAVLGELSTYYNIMWFIGMSEDSSWNWDSTNKIPVLKDNIQLK